MTEQFTFSEEKARAIGETIGVDWVTSRFDVTQFRNAWRWSSSTASATPRRTSATMMKSRPERSRAHLNEFPDYYTRLADMEAEAERYWTARDQDHAG